MIRNNHESTFRQLESIESFPLGAMNEPRQWSKYGLDRPHRAAPCQSIASPGTHNEAHNN
jgi:hypothetical protein